MNKDIDAQFLCKDCERYNLCQYYDRRKEDSYICKYFHLSAEPCEDAISRRATVERLCKVAEFINEKRDGLGSPYIMAALFIQDNKDEFPSVTPKQRTGHWIPVSERLPEDFQRVLVTIVNYNEDKVVRVAEYYKWEGVKGTFHIKENHERWEVGEKGLLAWMPLPEPYKAESENAK